MVMACHVMAVPYPGRGHINPMMNLCKQLLLLAPSLPSHLTITFVVTEEWLAFLQSESKEMPPAFCFATIPNVLPSELDRAADMPSFVAATHTRMGDELERLLDAQDRPPPNLIVADTFLGWAVECGNRRSIAVASLWTMPASVFSILYYFHLLVRNLDHPFQLSKRGNERVDYIPGIPSIRLADTPSILHTKDQRLLHLALKSFAVVSNAQYLLFTTVKELEPQTIQALKQEFSFPVYTFGPCLPISYLKETISFSSSTNESGKSCYFEWLDAQPPRSVLYVSLGSFLCVSSAQVDEMADGLCKSGVRFLWVARGQGEAARLQGRCGDAGRVVGWCEQLKVLCHSCIGGFWTHCGWNSMMESMFAGVPVIAFPILMDQTTIRKHVVEDWKIGWDGKKGVGAGEGDVVRSGEIAKVVNKLMDMESVERQEMDNRAEQVKKMVRGAVSDGGSSVANLKSFLHHVMVS